MLTRCALLLSYFSIGHQSDALENPADIRRNSAMPIHDWSQVDANLFHDFHLAWTIGLKNQLNGGLLPPGVSAIVETQGPRQTQSKTRPKHEGLAASANRITIRRPLSTIRVVIEIVSPGNKSNRAALRQFVEKTVEFLEAGVHVLVVDLLPPSARDPQGIHKAIWDEIEEQPFQLPPDKPLTLAAYVAAACKTAYVHPIGVGDTLPDMPAWLDERSYVPVPLDATYQATWASCPVDMREVVEHGLPLDDRDA
jgi:hypothetical protein